MKKILTFLLAALMLVSLVACGANNSNNKKHDDNTSQNETKKPDDTKNAATPDEIEAAIAKAIGKEYLCDTDISAEDLSLKWDLDMTKIESYVAKENAISSVNLDVVVVLKCKEGYTDTAVEKLNQHYGQFVNYIYQYPFSVAKVTGGRLYRNGDILALIVAGASPADDATSEDEAKLAVEEYTKIDTAIKLYFSDLKNLAVVPEDNGGFSFDDGGFNYDDGPLVG